MTPAISSIPVAPPVPPKVRPDSFKSETFYAIPDPRKTEHFYRENDIDPPADL